jgi:hypothetical protein
LELNEQYRQEPRFLDNVRAELIGWRIWFERGVVLAYAVAAGLFVVAFAWTPVCTAGIVWATGRWFAGAAGSGIPQVMDPL